MKLNLYIGPVEKARIKELIIFLTITDEPVKSIFFLVFIKARIANRASYILDSFDSADL
jgi:hypothetical protein